MMEVRAATIETLPSDIQIWHYTSPDVFWKMLSGEFYATHFRFLNDPTEIISTIEKIDYFFKNDLSLNDLRFFLQDLQKSDFFLLCFSQVEDNLYHWRSYAPNGGFGIGFSYNEMSELLNKQEYDCQKGKNLNYSLLRCYYPESLDGTIQKEIDDLKMAMGKWTSEERSLLTQYLAEGKADESFDIVQFLKSKSQDFLSTVIDVFSKIRRLYVECPAFKDHSFAVEHEYRLLITGENLRPQIQFIGNKPRIKIPIPELSKCIKKVYVSPQQRGVMEKNYLLAEIARERFKLNFEIQRSKCPYDGS